jgi:WD40-like Beta Propeller Repeat
MAFNSNQNSPAVLPNRIFVMNVDGTHVRQITHGGPQVHDLSPNYSPDGTKIVFDSDRMNTPGTLDLFTMNSDGSNITRIATGITVGGCADFNCVSAAWGPMPAERATMRNANVQSITSSPVNVLCPHTNR